MKIKRTSRGFKRAEFNDYNGVGCSIQLSSLATEQCIWFGCNEPNPQVLAFKLNGGTPDGWVALPLPKGISMDDILCDTRMHLTRKQVKALLPILKRFVESGEI